MKKIVLLIMSVLMVISMTGCPNPTNPPTPKTITVTTADKTVIPDSVIDIEFTYDFPVESGYQFILEVESSSHDGINMVNNLTMLANPANVGFDTFTASSVSPASPNVDTDSYCIYRLYYNSSPPIYSTNTIKITAGSGY